MAKNYSITFRSLRGGTMYVVSIEGGTGDPVPLKGGLSPFVTEEDNSEDAFEAVRTSSGYIRIVNDGKDANGNAFDWRDLIPATDLSRPVTLRNGQGTTLWVGFMQAQNFGNVLYGDPQELEFPIQCCIAALNSQQVTTNPTQLHNFAYLLYNFFITQFASIPSHGFANFVIQGGNDARAWLLQRIDWQNFLRENEENDLESAYSKGQVLEEMCKYWGWTLRTKGNTVYLTMMDDSQEQTLLTLTAAQLQTLAGGVSAGTVTSVGSAIALGGDIYASIDNDDYQNRGPNKASVNASCNEHETVMQCFPSYIRNQLEENGTWTWHTNQNNKIGWFETQQFGSFESALVYGEGQNSYGAFSRRQVFTSEESDSAAECDMILINHTYTGLVYATLRTKKPMSFAGGSLKLSGTVYFDDYICDWDEGTRLKMRLGIGPDRNHARWWYMNDVSNQDPSNFRLDAGWTAQGTVAQFNAPVTAGLIHSTGCKDSIGEVINIKASYDYIPTASQNMFGYMYIDILGLESDEGTYRQTFQIADFKVEFMREVIELPTTTGQVRPRVKHPERKGTRKYTATNSNSAQDEWNRDTIWASDNLMKWGFGLVLAPDTCSPRGKQPYNNNAVVQYPEQHLVNRVTSYWSSSKRRLKVQLRTNELTGSKPEPTPADKVTLDGTTFQAISINHEWADDVTTLYLLQV